MTGEELRGALDGLYAYDGGAVDSGIHDEELRARCITELKRLGAEGKNLPSLSRLIRDMWLSEEALAQGYGIEDAVSFVGWLNERMEITIR